MNLLIVDDEVIAISAIMNTIDWDMLPLDQILTANSFQQAVQVFAEKPVDIVLCDIERIVNTFPDNLLSDCL